ncbi:hypothetical protein COLO4_19699 [Corchorus olitorius]|uniref:Reverse transcriptase n=1 Tax=Corchorus olitorius TaxID=93759 RepID=A0A1R3J3Y5_9ROSI|nr:hypothetical protein COLO4_19699 [Corchorus olitorius]
MINFIKNKDGQVTGDQGEIAETFIHSFKEIFQEPEKAEEQEIISILQEVNMPVLNHQQKALLNAPFTAEEVKDAAYQMSPLKAPGIDGKPGAFYQKFWDIVVAKKQNNSWYGGAAMARKENGEAVVVISGFKADTVSLARIMILRAILVRLEHYGARRIWIRDKSRKWGAHPLAMETRKIADKAAETRMSYSWP